MSMQEKHRASTDDISPSWTIFFDCAILDGSVAMLTPIEPNRCMVFAMNGT